MAGKAYYIYSRGIACSAGVLLVLFVHRLLKYGASAESLTNPEFLFDLGMGLLCSFPFASFAAERKWNHDHKPGAGQATES